MEADSMHITIQKAKCFSMHNTVFKGKKSTGYRKFSHNNEWNKSREEKPFIRCYYCDKPGHIKRNCYKLKNKENYSSNGSGNQTRLDRAAYNTEVTGDTFSFLANLENSLEDSSRIEENPVSCVISGLNDSGCNAHMINCREGLVDFEKLDEPKKIVSAKNGQYMLSSNVGELNIITNEGITGELKNVFLLPELRQHLFSVRQIDKSCNFWKRWGKSSL